jgi:hypothetical protein
MIQRSLWTKSESSSCVAPCKEKLFNYLITTTKFKLGSLKKS